MEVTGSRPSTKILVETVSVGHPIAPIEGSEVDDQPLLRGDIKRLFLVDLWCKSSGQAADPLTKFGVIGARGQPIPGGLVRWLGVIRDPLGGGFGKWNQPQDSWGGRILEGAEAVATLATGEPKLYEFETVAEGRWRFLRRAEDNFKDLRRVFGEGILARSVFF